MIILDTNVVAKLMRPHPEPRVVTWLRTQPVVQLATTTITLAEVGVGLARLPESRRRFTLEAKFKAFVSRGLGPRVFGFDQGAAEIYGELVAERERAGRPLDGFDGLIAAIARAQDAAVATRNIGDFGGCGVELVDPWSADLDAG